MPLQIKYNLIKDICLIIHFSTALGCNLMPNVFVFFILSKPIKKIT